MDELGARRRRMRRQIVLLDKGHRKPAPGGITRDSAPVDAAADDQQVDGRGLIWHARRVRLLC